MATIQIILQAINNASRAFNDVADSGDRLSGVLDAVTQRLDDFDTSAAVASVAASALRNELDAVARQAAVAGTALGDAAASADHANVNFAALSVTARDLDTILFDVGSSLVNLDLNLSAAANRAADLTRALAGASAAALANARATGQATSAVRDLRTAAATAAAALAALDLAAGGNANAARQAGAAVFGWFGAWNALGQKIPLWGGLLDGMLPGILTSVRGWHLLGDAVLEVIAVWGGAAIAVGAFSLAASDAFNNVVRQVTNMHTVMDATGQSFSTLTGNLEAMHKAVQPQVYQIFGDVLTVAAQRGGALNDIIKQTGTVLDQLAARAAVAIQSSQFSSFIGNAVTDVRLLGTAFGNLFGILGNLIRMNQGWATILLQVGTDILGLIERLTGLIIPLGQLLVLGHGFVLWVGLAVTGAVKFGQILAGWGTALAAGIADLASLVRIAIIYVQQVGLMTAASEAFAAVNPFVWVGLAVGALAGLVFWLSQSKDGIQQWAASAQQAITSATSLSQGVRLMNNDLGQAAAHLADAKTALTTAAGAAGEYTTITNRYGVQTQVLRVQLQGAAKDVRDYTAAQQQLSADQQLYNGRVAQLAQTYGGTTNAMGLLNAAGITMNQMLDKSAGTWAIVQQQVAATYAAYQAMGNQAGTIGNDLAILNKQATDQYQAMQKLNQAWDTQTAAMTGTQTAFDTAAQGYTTLASSSGTFTLRLGVLSVSLKNTQAAIDSLSPSGVALNQAFSQQVGQVNSLADSWRSAGLSANLFNSGLAAAIAPLEKYAAGSSEATAQLVGLAQEAGYQGPNSLNAMNQYLGITSGMLKNTSGDLKTMKDAANQATIQEALLTGAMQAQGNYISSQLLSDINQAILKYDGVEQAAKNYGTALAQWGASSTQAKTAQDQLTQSLIKAGEASGSTTGQIAAMIAKILGIPSKVALEIVMTGLGSYTLNQVSSGKLPPAASGVVNPNIFTQPAAAAGLYITRGTGPTADDVLARVSRGELIVPAHMVTAGAVDHLRGSIPGFAAGGMPAGPGLVLAGDRSVLTGDYAVAAYGSFKGSFTQAMVTAMRRGMGLYDQGGLLPPGLSVADNQTGSPELVLPNAVVQGFTGGMQQLHTPLSGLTDATKTQATATVSLTAAVVALTDATKGASVTSKLVSDKAAAPGKPAPPLPAQIAADEKKISADQANASMLAQHLDAVHTAIKDTPKSDKAGLAAEKALEATITKALDKQNTETKADQAALRKALTDENKQTVTAMEKQIEAITKLLGSGTAAVSPSGLWATLAKDEQTLAAAEQALKDIASGKTGGSSSAPAAATATATNTASSAASLNAIKSQISAQYAVLDKLYAEQQTASVKSQISAIWSTLDKLYAQEDALTKGAKGGSTAKGATAATSAGGASSGSSSTGQAYSVVVDRKAESDLDQLLAQVREENTTLKQILSCLGKIETEADPNAQAKAIGPAVAAAINSTASAAAGKGGRSTRRG